MSAAFRLPPSERDFEVFFRVAFYSVSTRQVAEMFEISQTRVRQLVTLVGDWVAENLPDVGEADLQKQVRLAQHVAANRLEHQYEEAMNRWNAEGDPKHLRQATRIALAQARLGVVAGRVHALAADVTAGPLELGDLMEGPSRVHEQREMHRNNGEVSEMSQDNGKVHCAPLMHPTDSPVGDCSPDSQAPSNGQQQEAKEIAASDCPETLIERERQHRLMMVRGLTRMEGRLLTLIENQGPANPEKVASLQKTLRGVREEKATAELRLAPYIRGVQIEALEVPRMDPVELAAE
jgi:hypothetical protein